MPYPPQSARRCLPLGGRGLPAALLVLLGTVLLAGCGSGGSSSTQLNGARTSPTIALLASLTITSPFALTASYTDAISSAAEAGTCADAAKGFLQDGQRYEPPHNGQDTKLPSPDGRSHAVTLSLHIAPYKGPGSYAKETIVGDVTEQLAQVDGVAYGTANGGTATMVVNPDGSGTLTLGALTLAPVPTPEPTTAPTGSASPVPATPAPPPTPVPAVAPLSATLSWTCVQVRAPTPTPAPSTAAPATAAPAAAAT